MLAWLAVHPVYGQYITAGFLCATNSLFCHEFFPCFFSAARINLLNPVCQNDVDMNSTKLVIPLHFISWKNTPNDAVTPQRQSQFTPKMKANAVPRLLSSLV